MNEGAKKEQANERVHCFVDDWKMNSCRHSLLSSVRKTQIDRLSGIEKVKIPELLAIW